MVGGKRLLFGAKQQPDEHSGHPRKGKRGSIWQQALENCFFLLIYIHFVCLFVCSPPPAVVEDTNQCRHFLGRPERSRGGGRLGVERRHHLRGISVVCDRCWSPSKEHVPWFHVLLLVPFSFWMQGQPDNWGDEPGEDCGQVVGYNNGHWNDADCSIKRKYICKHVNRKCRIPARRPTARGVSMLRALFCSQPWAAVRPDRRLESVRLQLLQSEGGHQEELVGGQVRLRAGRGGPGVRFVPSRGAVHHLHSGPVLL